MYLNVSKVIEVSEVMKLVIFGAKVQKNIKMSKKI